MGRSKGVSASYLVMVVSHARAGSVAASCYDCRRRLVKVIDSFEVVDVTAPDGPVRVRHRGCGVEVEVPGVVLEAQLELDQPARYLLLLTEDRPYEEVLHAVLLDARGRQLQHAQLGEPYAAGVLGELAVQDPHTLRFRFHPGRLHHLEIHDRPRGLRSRWMRLSSAPDPH